MSFLAPLFLLGAVAVAGPVLFHLIRRSTRERMQFSSLLFLHPTPPRTTRRRKLEHLVLLLLRCGAILLLAAGFARPFFTGSNTLPPATEEGRQLIVLLDTSASMRREGLWPKARALAAQYLERTSPADRVALMAFSRQSRPLVGFKDWTSWPVGQRAALANERLNAVSPGWDGTDLGQALISAAEEFAEDVGKTGAPGPREVVLISDLQVGAKVDALQGYDWPKGVRVILERVDPMRRGNAGLAIQNAASTGASDGHVRVRVVNSIDCSREKFLIGWDAESGTGFAGKPAEIYLPPGQNRIFSAPELPAGAATGALRLSGDDEDFDNTTYFAAPEKEHVSLAYFGSESANDPGQLLYYLQRAFADTARRQVRIISAGSNAPPPEDVQAVAGSKSQEATSPDHALPAPNLQPPLLGPQTAMAVIPSTLPPNQAQTVHDWLAGGKTALLVLTNAQAGSALATLTGWPELDIKEASGDFALLGEVDFNHPIFAPFADPRYSDFSHIHFWKHRCWTVPPTFPARVLAKFDDGAPALAQITIGKGNLLALFAGWNPADSQLALSTKFVPLLQTILDWSGGAEPTRTQFEIGDSIPSPVPSGDPLPWRKPDGKVVTLPAGTSFSDTDIPGLYTVPTSAGPRHFAVNLPLDESRTAPLSVDDFAVLGVPLGTTARYATATAPGMQRHVLQAELENRQKLWRWLMAALLAVALVEVLLGGWLGTRATRTPT